MLINQATPGHRAGRLSGSFALPTPHDVRGRARLLPSRFTVFKNGRARLLPSRFATGRWNEEKSDQKTRMLINQATRGRRAGRLSGSFALPTPHDVRGRARLLPSRFATGRWNEEKSDQKTRMLINQATRGHRAGRLSGSFALPTPHDVRGRARLLPSRFATGHWNEEKSDQKTRMLINQATPGHRAGRLSGSFALPTPHDVRGRARLLPSRFTVSKTGGRGSCRAASRLGVGTKRSPIKNEDVDQSSDPRAPSRPAQRELRPPDAARREGEGEAPAEPLRDWALERREVRSKTRMLINQATPGHRAGRLSGASPSRRRTT